MIKQITIDEVRAKMDTREVMEQMGVVFKRDKACCPFHGEKSASMHVWKRNNIFKCFGCGVSGDAITFIMKHERKTFMEAVEQLAGLYNITVERDQEAQKKLEETKETRTVMAEVLAFSQKKFEDMLHSMPADSEVWNYLNDRGFNTDFCREWSLGFAPDDWKFLTTPLINAGQFNPAMELGIISTSSGKNFDFYRNRITIPIHNNNGQLVGFGGRILGKGEPKYFNPRNSLLYNKDAIWFGLDRAAKAIKEWEYVYVVEGYFDVMSMHLADVCNAVAACGTEVTEGQAKILKRYTDHVVIALDGDKPGITKTMKLINTFFKLGFKVELINFPDNKDPDEYIRYLKQSPTEIVAMS